jgi:hypothetical protein
MLWGRCARWNAATESRHSARLKAQIRHHSAALVLQHIRALDALERGLGFFVPSAFHAAILEPRIHASEPHLWCAPVAARRHTGGLGQ